MTKMRGAGRRVGGHVSLPLIMLVLICCLQGLTTRIMKTAQKKSSQTLSAQKNSLIIGEDILEDILEEMDMDVIHVLKVHSVMDMVTGEKNNILHAR